MSYQVTDKVDGLQKHLLMADLEHPQFLKVHVREHEETLTCDAGQDKHGHVRLENTVQACGANNNNDSKRSLFTINLIN